MQVSFEIATEEYNAFLNHQWVEQDAQSGAAHIVGQSNADNRRAETRRCE